jgi:MtN3 and saliva related transmembrane protein
MVEHMNPEWVGYIAAVLTTAAYVPQFIKVFREKHTSSLSLVMYSLITTGIGLWFVYGLMIDSPSLMISNSISFVMALGILLMKIKHG